MRVRTLQMDHTFDLHLVSRSWKHWPQWNLIHCSFQQMHVLNQVIRRFMSTQNEEPLSSILFNSCLQFQFFFFFQFQTLLSDMFSFQSEKQENKRMKRRILHPGALIRRWEVAGNRWGTKSATPDLDVVLILFYSCSSLPTFARTSVEESYDVVNWLRVGPSAVSLAERTVRNGANYSMIETEKQRTSQHWHTLVCLK